MASVPDAKRPYRLPKQARAQATCAAIFEATARIIEAEGEVALNTNRIAAVAGVSVGTLYQYFPNKQAILVAMAHAERVAWARNAKAAIAAGLEPERAWVRTMIQAFPGRPHTRRAAVKAQLDVEPPQGARPLEIGDGPGAIEAFISTRAMVGVVRAAVFEDAPFLNTPEFEDTVVRLVQTFRLR